MRFGAEDSSTGKPAPFGPCGSAEELVPAALFSLLQRQVPDRPRALPPNDALLDNADALYNRERRENLFLDCDKARLSAFHVAHEFAHHWLDEIGAQCRGDDLDLATPAEPEMSLVGDPMLTVQKSALRPKRISLLVSSLLPRNKLRGLCQGETFDAERIATDVGVR